MHNSPLTQAPEGKQRHDRMTTASVLLRRGAIAFPAARKRVSCALASSLPAASAASAAHLPIHARSFPLVHAPSSSPFSFQHRSVFTYPAPRKLTDIMKVPLVRKCEPVEIKEMWQEYHKERRDALASTIPAQQFKILKDRAKASRVFLYPVFRESGYMTLISQFQDSCFLFTFLEDFRKNPSGATPWLCLTLYDEFMADKCLGLLRGDVGHHLTREEGEYLITQLVEHYTHAELYKTLWTFNHEPKSFSFEKYVRGVRKPDPPKKAPSPIIT